jgi:hypothetical protein
MPNIQLISAKVKKSINIYCTWKHFLENFYFIWLRHIFPNAVYLLVWFITVWIIIQSNMQHYKIQQYSFNKNPFLIITVMFKHIWCSYIFTVLWNYIIGWCDMVFNIDSNKICTFFYRNMNIHCVLHTNIETFRFLCSSTLGGLQVTEQGDSDSCLEGWNGTLTLFVLAHLPHLKAWT